MVIKATKVDWVYDKDPVKNPDAIKFDKITHQEAFKRGLKIMDHSAIATAMDNNMPIFVCKVDEIEKIWTTEANWSLVYSE
jgi:uridylate kinase